MAQGHEDDEGKQPAPSQGHGRTTALWVRFLTLHNLRARLSGQPRLVIVIAVIGYLLSPFSAYNDALVNIPPSWLLAHLTARLIPLHAAILAGIYYVLSNILGIAMLAWAFSRIRPRPTLRWSLTARHILSGLLYVLITVALMWVGFGGIAQGVRGILGR